MLESFLPFVFFLIVMCLVWALAPSAAEEGMPGENYATIRRDEGMPLID